MQLLSIDMNGGPSDNSTPVHPPISLAVAVDAVPSPGRCAYGDNAFS